MLDTLLNSIFGCTHNRTTFPITPGRTLRSSMAHGHRHGTYVACLDCGQEFQYNWDEMRIGEPVQAKSYRSPAESFSPANQ